MNDRQRSRAWVRIGLLLLFVVHFWLAFDWLGADSEPLFWDGAEHAGKIVKVQHNLYRSAPPMRGELLPPSILELSAEQPWAARVALAPLAGLANLVESIYLGAARPPLSYWLSGLLLGWQDASSDRISAAHGLAWFLALIWATYLLGTELSHRATGFLAAVVVSGYPLLVGQARVPMLDTPLAAATVFSLWSFLRSSEFRDRRWALVFGATCGAGLLIKQSFPLGLALPVSWVLGSMAWQWWRLRPNPPAEIVQRAANVGRAIFGLALAAGPWYLVNTPSTLRFLAKSRMASIAEGDPASFSLDGLLFYPVVIVDVALGPILAGAAIAGIMVLIFAGGRRERLTLGLGLLGILLVFVLLYPNKDARYISPALPLLAVATAMAVNRIPFVSVRRFAFAVLVMISLATSMGSTRGSPILRARDSSTVTFLNSLFDVSSFYAHEPRPGDWEADSILASVHAHRGGEPGTIGLLVVNGGLLLKPALVLAEERNRLRVRDRLPVQHIDLYGEDDPVSKDGDLYVLVERERGTHDDRWVARSAVLVSRGLQQDQFESLLKIEALPHGGSAELFFYDGEGVD